MESHIGQRLSFQGDRCTVRYVGKIEGKDGSWFGVEWDDDMKGRHDGALNGHRYFYCQSRSPTAGSFVRPTRKSDAHLSFLEALEQKYASPGSKIEAIQISGKTVEEVGFEKIQKHLQNYQQLETVILDRHCISVDQHLKVSQVRKIRDLHLKIQKLDLSRNLIETWNDVFSICTHLEHLRDLDVAGNRFSDTDLRLTSETTTQTSWPIKILSVQNTFLSWEQIVTVVCGFPDLSSLNASRNNIFRISLPFRYSGIRTLDLSFNDITSVEELELLSELPYLESLSLRANPVSSLLTKTGTLFVSLQHLDLTGTKLPNLNSLDLIPKVFPRLNSLQTKDTPLSEAHSATLFTIARLPKLKELNNSPITVEERQNAEIFYLNTIVKELELASNEAEEAKILRNHPAWEQLCETHGIPTIQRVSKDSAADLKTLEARITVFTFYISSSAWEDRRHTYKREREGKARLSAGSNTQNREHLKSEDERLETPLPPTDAQNPTTETQLPSTAATAQPTDILEKSASIPRTTSTYALQGVVGRLFSLPPPFTTTIRLFYETDEWDPVAGTDGVDDGWSVSEDEDEDHIADRERRRKERGRMVRRTEELAGSTKPVGDWVTEKEARVKVVLV